ncbi:MAG: hypothetical protein J6A01_09560, partial [Proteobacteria bacterium]|nr:hypothetical protein [Pseudomonadota bacterium]
MNGGHDYPLYGFESIVNPIETFHGTSVRIGLSIENIQIIARRIGAANRRAPEAYWPQANSRGPYMSGIVSAMC